MTTTAQPKTKEPHNDWKHGPWAAAFNASACSLAVTTIVKLFGGIPPWVPLVVSMVLAGCLVVAGQHRQPRPLSRKSLVYRASVALLVGWWMWFQLATFPAVDVNTSQLVALLVSWPAALITAAVTVGSTRLPALVRYGPPAVAVAFAGGITYMLRGQLVVWFEAAFTVVDRLPHTRPAVDRKSTRLNSSH